MLSRPLRFTQASPLAGGSLLLLPGALANRFYLLMWRYCEWGTSASLNFGTISQLLEKVAKRGESESKPIPPWLSPGGAKDRNENLGSARQSILPPKKTANLRRPSHLALELPVGPTAVATATARRRPEARRVQESLAAKHGVVCRRRQSAPSSAGDEAHLTKSTCRSAHVWRSGVECKRRQADRRYSLGSQAGLFYLLRVQSTVCAMGEQQR